MTCAVLETREAQQPLDPYLCHWSEWYFLVLLSHLFTHLESTAHLHVACIRGAETQKVSILQKAMIGISQSDRPMLQVRLGANTGLVLESPDRQDLVGMVVIPTVGGWITGRKLSMLTDFSSMHDAVPQMQRPYLELQHQLVNSARQALNTTGYPQLYVSLLQHIVENARFNSGEYV